MTDDSEKLNLLHNWTEFVEQLLVWELKQKGNGGYTYVKQVGVDLELPRWQTNSVARVVATQAFLSSRIEQEYTRSRLQQRTA
jgi:hypothetical protein